MTDEEAKTRWCPFASSRILTYRNRTGVNVTVIAADNETEQVNIYCLGSGCMAWRWDNDGSGGYCGLAGEP